MNYYIAMAQKQEIFTLVGGRIKMLRGTYNPTSDAVWLAAFLPKLKPKAHILDVGIGSGGVSLCITSHTDNVQITGIDKSAEMLACCKKNAELNTKDIELINADILTWRTSQTFDAVVTNPPYFHGTPAKHDAHHNANLTMWVKRCIARTKPRGYFCTIVSADRLSEIVAEMNTHCGDITILPLFGAKKTAERVLLRGRVGVKSGTTLYAGLPMNYEPVLRDGLTIEDSLATLGWI